MDRKIVLFAGTSEGRALAQLLSDAGRPVVVSVATEYGEQLLGDRETLQVHCGRMDEAQMRAFLQEEAAGEEGLLVIDATHPYATLVSETLKKICTESGMEYIRLLRDASDECEESAYVHPVDTIHEAAALSEQLEGNIFLTTGSKELQAFMQEISDPSRVFARVLPSKESLELCEQAGLSARQLVCMQGPFTKELNQAMYGQLDAKVLVTKESGTSGGFSEKLLAAQARGMHCIVLRRPKETGLSFTQVCGRLGLPAEPLQEKPDAADEQGELLLIGIGMGGRGQMTMEAIRALSRMPVVFGAKRMLEAVADIVSGEMIPEYRSEGILTYLQQHPLYTRAAVVFSGDVGFYSGADGFGQSFQCGKRTWGVKRIPGISSVNFFAARLGIPWQEARLCSIHGRHQDLLGEIRRSRLVFSLLSDSSQLQELSRKLCEQKLMKVCLSVGFDLGYESERIWKGSPAQFLEEKDLPQTNLLVACFENEDASFAMTGALADTSFQRGKVPLSKEEIRALALSKLQLQADSICVDIGAGTGGMTCDMARFLPYGQVLAFERSQEGCGLIRANVKRQGLNNVRVTCGVAPECLEDVAPPTHAFIGGSGGRLREIVRILLEKNPRIRIVIDAVTLETVSEANQLMDELPVKNRDIICATVAKARKAGSYQLMESMNPVYIFSFTGNG